MKDYSVEFNQCWERFITNTKAKLMDISKNSPLRVSGANLALKDSVSGWFDKYDIEGNWLFGLKEERPDTANAIENILRYDMVFTEVERSKGISDIAAYAIPIGGAMLGAGISALTGAKTAVKLISIIAPAAVLTPVMKSVQQNKNTELDKKLLGDYIIQLYAFKDKILTLLK